MAIAIGCNTLLTVRNNATHNRLATLSRHSAIDGRTISQRLGSSCIVAELATPNIGGDEITCNATATACRSLKLALICAIEQTNNCLRIARSLTYDTTSVDSIVVILVVVATRKARYLAVVYATTKICSSCRLLCSVDLTYDTANVGWLYRARTDEAYLATIVTVYEVNLATDSCNYTTHVSRNIVCTLDLTVVCTVGNNHLIVWHSADTCRMSDTNARREYIAEVVATSDFALGVTHDTANPALIHTVCLRSIRGAGYIATVDTHLDSCLERLAQDTADLVETSIVHRLDCAVVLATNRRSCDNGLWIGCTTDTSDIDRNILALLATTRDTSRINLAIVATTIYEVAVRTYDTTDIDIATGIVRLVSQVSVVLAILHSTTVDIGNPTHKGLATLGLNLHRTRSVDAEVLNLTTLQQLVEKSVLSLPILQGVALAIENATERLYDRQLLNLCHIDIGFEAHLALIVLEGREILALVDGCYECHHILRILDTARIYYNHREEEEQCQ